MSKVVSMARSDRRSWTKRPRQRRVPGASAAGERFLRRRLFRIWQWRRAMVPGWLQAFAAIYVPLSVLTALWVAFDIWRGHRQPMAVMNAVWPLTALYWGPIGLIFY